MADTPSSGGGARERMGVQVSLRAQKEGSPVLNSPLFPNFSSSGNSIGNHAWDFLYSSTDERAEIGISGIRKFPLEV